MSVGFTNWAELGFFPLQDHEDGVPLGMRQQLAAGRIKTLTDPINTDDPAECVHVVGVEDDMGTIGDLWPWAFWQTADREERHTGVWAQSWAGITVKPKASGGPITGPGTPDGPPGVLPMVTSQHGVDGRMKVKQPTYPKSFSQLPEGWDVVVMPAMEESTQHLVQLSVDPRIVVANVSGPGECSTLFVDLQPDNHPCMDYGGKKPGQNGRSARSASMMKVIPLNANSAGPLGAGDYNGLAWNCALSKQEKALGLGMCWIEMNGDGGPMQGPITGRPVPVGPITPMREGHSGTGQASYGGPSTGRPSLGGGGAKSGSRPRNNAEGGDSGDTPDGPTANASGGGRHDRDRETPDDWGKFTPKPQGGHGVTFMAQLGASGPLDGGYGQSDKHAFGTDLDGNPMVSAHISTNAYFVKDKEFDAPLEFKGRYPYDVKTAPLKVEVTLDYDQDKSHPWVRGSKSGLWRWWSTTHVCIPDGPVTPVDPMGGPVEGPPTPTPVSPGPTTPGPGTPVSPRPTTPMRRSAMGPITPMRRAYPGPNPVLPNYGRPITGGPMRPPTGPTTGGRGRSPVQGPVEGWEKIPSQYVDAVGGNHGAVSAFQIYHPLMEGFSAMSFRPIAWVMGEPSTIHNNEATSDSIHCAEQHLPQVISGYAFGGLDSSGAISHTQDPHTSRARGGTAPGGFMWTPPHLEPEDYFFETGLNVETVVDTALVLHTPGVNLGFGKPTRQGAIDSNGIVIRVDPADTSRLDLSQNVSGTMTSILTAKVVDGDPFVQLQGTGTVRIPTGTTAQRPSVVIDGETRVNSTTGLFEWYVGSAWVGAHPTLVAPTWLALTDTPGSFTALKIPAVNAGGNAIVFPGPTINAAGTLHMQADIEFDDDDGIKFGTGDDAKISYNGTNLIINPDVAGSGICRVEASFRATGNVRSDTAFRLGSATGATVSVEFGDAGGQTHTVAVQGGIITSWSIVS